MHLPSRRVAGEERPRSVRKRRDLPFAAAKGGRAPTAHGKGEARGAHPCCLLGGEPSEAKCCTRRLVSNTWLAEEPRRGKVEAPLSTERWELCARCRRCRPELLLSVLRRE